MHAWIINLNPRHKIRVDISPALLLHGVYSAGSESQLLVYRPSLQLNISESLNSEHRMGSTNRLSHTRLTNNLNTFK